MIVSYDAYTGGFPAILDSGAEYTSIPARIATDFHLEKRGEILVVGTTGPPEVQEIYEVNLEFLGLSFALHPVLAGTGAITQEFILIGRDILNKYQVMLDGPSLVFTIE